MVYITCIFFRQLREQFNSHIVKNLWRIYKSGMNVQPTALKETANIFEQHSASSNKIFFQDLQFLLRFNPQTSNLNFEAWNLNLQYFSEEFEIGEPTQWLCMPWHVIQNSVMMSNKLIHTLRIPNLLEAVSVHLFSILPLLPSDLRVHGCTLLK